ncbi:helix-turn-helix transcriptional regulator [Streptomyces scabiei]|uniref:helix-turn-helix domain-containing protein n=1 Tax=Streptomyces scabiei TaxID=1930 RepID=UPI001B30A17C|nr:MULTISPECIES: helix-turn-helix transcriptional regulator [Streptomyces]MBP5875887.1 helix-turn-helix domain-containing protein [Streptomyces sp. LBUM 1477]MBP5883607.1 helix-turn-helix domain-containing protein [Streptomyces sp. LBUM 1487]MDW8473119.1 helix-turn-helix transcriptional regulator [Streptomyces scabiei]MDX2573755.1 helix-turn-helix transcriptional regulator [Streptomyces scabiei]MDX2633282.1 helix-turn-helix transcriptional regulator [Streptomyces scabiei]
MVKRREPTARQMRLANELRRLREAAGLSSREAASLLGVSPAQITHIESALAGVSELRLRRLASHYACTDEEFIDALVAMATDRTRGWWEEYRGLLPTPFLDLAELEHHARFQRHVAILYVPGLLQTEDYARAVFSSRLPELTEEEVELRIRHRMARQAVALPYEAVIHEAALRIRVSGRAASRAQLAKILDLSEVDNVTVRVIPFDLDGFARAASAMAFVGGPLSKLDTVVRDAPHGSVFIDSEAQLNSYRTRFRRVEDASLEPGASREFIHNLAREL